MKLIWLIAIGGCIGATARFCLANKVKPINGFPLSTLLVNVIGSFLLGFFSGAVLNSTIALLVGTGILGSFTTFSTLKVEIVSLLDQKKMRTAFFIWLSAILAALCWHLEDMHWERFFLPNCTGKLFLNVIGQPHK